MRRVHLLVGFSIGAFVYSAARENEAFVPLHPAARGPELQDHLLDYCRAVDWTVVEATREEDRVPQAVRFDEYGGIDVLYVADVERPRPGPGRVFVRVRAAGINPGEAAIREGEFDGVCPTTFPSGQGSDLAGVVEELGDGVEGSRRATRS